MALSEAVLESDTTEPYHCTVSALESVERERGNDETPGNRDR